MSRLFASLYLDEDVDVLVAELVRARQFDVLTARDAGQLGKSDEEQLLFAAGDARTLVTHNRRDFEALATRYSLDSRSHDGIIIAVRRSPYELARRLSVILDQTTADEMTGQLLYI